MKLLKEEMIGREIEVIDSKNKSNIGIEGKIIDETKSTIIVADRSKKRRLLKSHITILLKNERIKIKGALLMGRPEDRLKR